MALRAREDFHRSSVNCVAFMSIDHDERLLLKTPRFDVFCRAEMDRTFYYLRKNNGVSAICIDVLGRILLLTVTRFNLEGPCFELPGGRIEGGEDPVAAICREVFEETGIVIARNSFSELTAIIPLPSISTETIHVFVAKNITVLPCLGSVIGHEGISNADFYDRQSVLEMIKAGTVSSAVDGYSMLYYFLLMEAK